jgi:hypothetical protein
VPPTDGWTLYTLDDKSPRDLRRVVQLHVPRPHSPARRFVDRPMWPTASGFEFYLAPSLPPHSLITEMQ